MKVACIIQARLGSTRLPAKVLLPLPTGRTVIEEVIHRCKMIKGVDVVVVAVPDGDHIVGGAAFKALCRPLPDDTREHAFVCGPEHDVLARYAKAAECVNADVIMRITADCPLLDPDTCTEVLRLQQTTGADYASNCWPARHFPHGWDCEVFTRAALDRANEEATEPYDREHVTPFLYRNHLPDIKCVMLKAMEDRSHIRWTIDTLENYVTIWNEFKRREKEAA